MDGWRWVAGWLAGWLDGWRLIDRWMDGWIDGWVDRWIDVGGWMDGFLWVDNRWMDGWMDFYGWIDGWMDMGGRMDGWIWMAGWMDFYGWIMDGWTGGWSRNHCLVSMQFSVSHASSMNIQWLNSMTGLLNWWASIWCHLCMYVCMHDRACGRRDSSAQYHTCSYTTTSPIALRFHAASSTSSSSPTSLGIALMWSP